MSVAAFIHRQLAEAFRGGTGVAARKVTSVLRYGLRALLRLLVVMFGLAPAAALRLMRPWLLVRFGVLHSARIGHFAGNAELYLCERDAGINIPGCRYVDIFYMEDDRICNTQLATMWKRTLRVWPAWIVAPVRRASRLLPGGDDHEVGTNTQHDRDVHNLLERFPPHLRFTAEEEARGEARLREMGIAPGAPFVCLIVRDSAYLASHVPGHWEYHNYRDCDVQRFVPAAEELADRGYTVLRMGAAVMEPLGSAHSRVIDYATNGMRDDFMDVYLGAKCTFCISTSTGWDAICQVFRRPIAYVNFVPLGYINTNREPFVVITKHHVMRENGRELSLSEIFNTGIGFSYRNADYVAAGLELIENTPEEIREVVLELVQRLDGTFQPHPGDGILQQRFWEVFPKDAVEATNGRPLHGPIRAHFGAAFLRANPEWLK